MTGRTARRISARSWAGGRPAAPMIASIAGDSSRIVTSLPRGSRARRQIERESEPRTISANCAGSVASLEWSAMISSSSAKGRIGIPSRNRHCSVRWILAIVSRPGTTWSTTAGCAARSDSTSRATASRDSNLSACLRTAASTARTTQSASLSTVAPRRRAASACA